MSADDGRNAPPVRRIDELVAGETVVCFALLTRCEQKSTARGGPYLDIELLDPTGRVSGKVWEERMRGHDDWASLANQSVKVMAEVGTYRGQTQLEVVKMRRVGEGEVDEAERMAQSAVELPEALEPLRGKTVVFDIETVPLRGRDEPSSVTASIAKAAERQGLESDAVRGLNPYLGMVCSIAIADGDVADSVDEVQALAVVPEGVDVELPDSVISLDEAQMLRSFWLLASVAGCIVSYNGRGFDVPFLVGRSLSLGVPVLVDLLNPRWAIRPHLDLFEITGQRGRGPANLDTVCWSLGVESPKSGMDGSQVGPAYERGLIDEIAEYNRRDVLATSQLYRKVRDLHLRFRTDW